MFFSTRKPAPTGKATYTRSLSPELVVIRLMLGVACKYSQRRAELCTHSIRSSKRTSASIFIGHMPHVLPFPGGTGVHSLIVLQSAFIESRYLLTRLMERMADEKSRTNEV